MMGLFDDTKWYEWIWLIPIMLAHAAVESLKLITQKRHIK